MGVGLERQKVIFLSRVKGQRLHRHLERSKMLILTFSSSLNLPKLVPISQNIQLFL